MTSTMKPLVFTDLDDTIFVNQRKLPAGFSGSFVTAVTDTDDRVSVMTAKQNSFFRWIIHTADVVPITARSYEAFKRIDLDFGHNWKIAGNGSVVINPANEIDRQWTRIMAAELPEYQACLQDKLDEALAAARALGLDATVKRYAEHGHDHCVLLVLNGERSHELHRIAQSELSDERLHVHHALRVASYSPIYNDDVVTETLASYPDSARMVIHDHDGDTADSGLTVGKLTMLLSRCQAFEQLTHDRKPAAAISPLVERLAHELVAKLDGMTDLPEDIRRGVAELDAELIAQDEKRRTSA